MLFNVNDVVVHEVYGVGKVTGIEELSWKEPECSRFYVIMIGDAKLWVPIENEKENHLRPITPKQDLPSYREIFHESPSKLDSSRFGRTSYIQESKKHTSFRALCETVRDLTSHSQSRKLANHETAFLQRVTHQLVEEWSLSAQIPLEQAQGEIDELLGDIPELPAAIIE